MLDEEKQGQLQTTDGMTDHAWKAFNELKVQLTGLYVCQRESTLKKLTEGSMPDFTVSHVDVQLKDKKVKWQMMKVNHTTDVIGGRVVSLLEGNLLIPSSRMTDLDDNTLMICIPADKAGNFLVTKVGLTIMNCVNPNSIELFELFASLDAHDSYQNYKTLLSKYEEDLDFYFDTDNVPNLLWLELDGQIVSTFVYNVDDGGSMNTVWKEREVVSSKMDSTSEGKHHGGPYSISKSTKIQLLQQDGMIWGLQAAQ